MAQLAALGPLHLRLLSFLRPREWHRMRTVLRLEPELLEALLAALPECSTSQLHSACESGDLDTVWAALRLGADVHARDDRRRARQTMLGHAAQKGQTRVCRLLLEARAATNARDTQGFAPLHFAAGKGQVDMVGMLLDAGAEVDGANEFGNQPLHSAAGLNHPGAVALLLGARADASLRNGQELTAADIARRRGHIEVVGLLERAETPSS